MAFYGGSNGSECWTQDGSAAFGDRTSCAPNLPLHRAASSFAGSRPPYKSTNENRHPDGMAVFIYGSECWTQDRSAAFGDRTSCAPNLPLHRAASSFAGSRPQTDKRKTSRCQKAPRRFKWLRVLDSRRFGRLRRSHILCSEPSAASCSVQLRWFSSANRQT